MILRQGIPLPRSVSFGFSRGFTLIELSVVVVIMVMLMSLGLGVLNAQLVSAAHGETKKRQALIKDALTAYLGANKRLPCPDDPRKTDGTPNTSPEIEVTGKEDRVDGSTENVCSGNIGVVPYATLGLSREVALDGWGNFMSYSIPVGSGTCPGTGPNPVIDWSRSKCFGAAIDSPYSLFEGTGVSPTLAASNVLAVVVSHGPNGFAAWGRVSQNVAPTRCEEKHNAKTGICSGKKPDGSDWTPDDFFGGEFTSEIDDVVVALTQDEAINTLVRQGTLKSAEGQVVEDLANLRNEILYKKANNCSYDPSVNDPPTNVPDPWGNKYYFSGSGLPICICSTRGVSPAPTCSTDTSTTCIHDYDVNPLRLRLKPDGESTLPCTL